MTSMMQPVTQGTNVLDEMDDMLGQISSIGSNQFTMSFVQCMPSMTITTDTNTAFIGFDAIGKSNSFSALAQGQIVMARMQLLAGGVLHAEKVRFESNAPQVLDGMVVAVNNSSQFDMVMTNEAPAFQGLNLGSLVRVNTEAGSMFDIDDTDLPVGGMSFPASSAMMVGQVVQIEPASALANGTPPQLNTEPHPSDENLDDREGRLCHERRHVHPTESARNDGIGWLFHHDGEYLCANRVRKRSKRSRNDHGRHRIHPRPNVYGEAGRP